MDKIGRSVVLCAAIVAGTLPAGPGVAADPYAPATTIGSGTAASTIGRISWTTLAGDANSLPAGEIFETPDGFAAIDPGTDGRASRFWVSRDGIHWAVAPMPVPAAGAVGHGVSAGEHWIWSESDFRLWRSSDFATWTEVDLEALRPVPVAGLEWRFWSAGPAGVGSTTILPWGVQGSLDLADLLGIPLPPGETLVLGSSREDPALGDERDVFRVQETVIGPDTETRVLVGSIRVGLDGSTVTVIDASRDAAVAHFDAATVGVPAEAMAETLNRYGFIDGPGDGAVILDGAARALLPPPDLQYLDAVGGRFVALAVDEQRQRLVWASKDGLVWEPLGPPIVPSETPWLQPVRQPSGDAGASLNAVVLIDEAGTQREELWSSADGLSWVSLGVTYTYPEPSLFPWALPTGGYLATGDDLRIHVSMTGADWSAVDWPRGVGRSVDENGGRRTTSVTRGAMFIVELPLDDDRVMWILNIDPRDATAVSPEVQADHTSIADLLPGASLVTEDVEPGVVRIVHDHHRDFVMDLVPDPEPARPPFSRSNLVAGLDGSVWVFGPDAFYRVGDEHTYPVTGETPNLPGQKAEVAPDGTLWTLVGSDDARSTIQSFDAGSWTVREEAVDAFDVALDGTVWVSSGGQIVRLRDGWTSPARVSPDDFWVSPVQGTQVAGDEVEVLVRSSEVYEACSECGLTLWLLTPGPDSHGGPAGALPIPVVAVDMGEGGDHWIYQRLDVPLAGAGSTGEYPNMQTNDYLVHVTGQTFTVYTDEEGVPSLGGGGGEVIFSAASDGSIWVAPRPKERASHGCGGVARFDGTTWTHYLLGRCVYALDIDTDGDVWLQAGLWADDGPRQIETYVIRPEAAVAAG